MDQPGASTLWSFTGDGLLTTAPILVDDFVLVGSGSGNVYALRTDTGNVEWTGTTGSAINSSEGDGTPTVLGGMAVGDGYLVVPAGNSLTAWRLVP